MTVRAEPILKIQQLDVSYHGTQILKDVTLDLNAGEILGIVGESGSGKSTLIKAIMGLLGDNGQIDHGKLEFDHVDLICIKKMRCVSCVEPELAWCFSILGCHSIQSVRLAYSFLKHSTPMEPLIKTKPANGF